ncbi:phosphotransferase [Altererythrobacter sp. SALINAS58]|uniref:aminoglycoside phosphotransferase family protein n=1 Tax=Alteripontixanthobacter muriae TaxID=2705546 RepID=UPI00157669DB|nr:phosphotransferase [Alteripontixanthobacter muriae]NTZ42083.1 phosphotransferase [Alteripontixanthobacter muriae]
MSDLPDGIEPFLTANGWADAAISPLPGDASFRRYFRLTLGGESAMLMHAPPPHEDPRPFLQVAEWLAGQELRAPAILAQDAAAGWVLIEDFGDDRMREALEADPSREGTIYAEAIDTLVTLHGKPAGPFEPYDMAVYRREVDLFVEWYCPLLDLNIDRPSWGSAWKQALEPLLEHQQPGVTVLRDYHAENIMLPPGGGQGLIDFQDALVGHPAYDLVSLLQDARRDVSSALEQQMVERYKQAVSPGPEFAADYARLGAQRNAKIVGIFARLWKRDNKARYLAYIPRVWEAMEQDLAHPALAPVADWFDANIPRNIRDNRGGELR